MIAPPATYHICGGLYTTWSEGTQSCVCVVGAERINEEDCSPSDPFTGGGPIGAGGMSGTMPGPMGGTAGSGGSTPPVDCSVCPTGSGAILILDAPAQCTNGVCRAICESKAESNHFACVARAGILQSQCNANMLNLLGQYCTQTIPPVFAQDLGFFDVQRWASAVCPRSQYTVGGIFGAGGFVLWISPACGDAIASAINAGKRSDCQGDLMSGSGPYFDAYSLTIDVQGQKFTIGNGGGGATSGLGMSGSGACLRREQAAEQNCDAAEMCSLGKCHGDSSQCNSTSAGSGSGSR